MLTSYAIQEARRIARQELHDEQMRRLIDAEKARLSSKRWWHHIIPFTITITITRRNP